MNLCGTSSAKIHPIIAKEYGTSHVWRSLVIVRDDVEQNIWWKVKAGNSSFWFDNWVRQRALYYIESENAEKEELEVIESVVNEPCNK